MFYMNMIVVSSLILLCEEMRCISCTTCLYYLEDFQWIINFQYLLLVQLEDGKSYSK